MDIGIAKEGHHLENRVALTPAAAQMLVRAGHSVYLEQDAGRSSGFLDEDYLKVGVKLVYSSEEIFLRSKLLLKVAPPTLDEVEMMTEGQIVMTAFHLAVAPESSIRMLLDKRITSVGLEILEDHRGSLPVVVAMSELAGQMCVGVGAHYLTNRGGGRGILLGGAGGVPPATVVVLGSGTLGINAIRTAVGIGARVIVFDNDMLRLRHANALFDKQISTYLPFDYNLELVMPNTDILIGAVSNPGEMAPKLVTRSMVSSMKPRSVIIDASIDQGGCVETSHPTNWANATYVEEHVTHFCVPNMPSNISRTATYALSNAILPFVSRIAETGMQDLEERDHGLMRGLYTYQGHAIRNVVARRVAEKPKPMTLAMKTGGAK